MRLRKNPDTSKKLNEKQWNEWNQTIFGLVWKIWLIIFLVQLFLAIFFEPTAAFTRFQYFWKFIITPSGLEGIILISFQILFTKIFKTHNRRIVSFYTILLMSAFAGITVCVHTTVTSLPTFLILPMILTPLYRDKFMTMLQAAIVIILYSISHFYFIPKATYTLPDNPFSPYVELSVFIGATIATYFMLEKVNATVVLNEERSKHDSLTHLYNHENFYEELEYYRNLFEKHGNHFSIIIADIDNFKKVNDTYGHAFGDEVIRQVGEIFVNNAKKEGFCARYGGEEFAMILPHANPLTIAEAIRSDFENFDFQTAEGVRHFTLSIGAAIYDKKYESGSKFFENADTALYHAKRTGKNRVVLSGTYEEN